MDEKSNLELIEIRTPVVYKHVVINNNVVKTNEVLKEAQIIKIKGETNE